MDTQKIEKNKWKKIAKTVSNFQTKLILTIVYFLLITPIALIYKIFADPLKLKKKKTANWAERKPEDLTILKARRQS